MKIIQNLENIDFTWTIKNLDYKKLIIIPLIVAAIMASIIIVQGVPLGLDFSGGTYLEARDIEVPENTDPESIKNIIEEEFDATIEVILYDDHIELEGFVGDGEIFGSEQIQRIREEILGDQFGIIIEDWDVREEMGMGITDIFVRRAQYAGIAAAIAITIIIFIAFRHLTTIGGILSVVGLDLILIFGGMIIFDIPLTLASLAGILLIIGYAIDDNVLLYTRVLKREGGDVREKASWAMKTGLTMGATSATALLVLNLVTTSAVLHQISAVMVMGIVSDLLNTWFFNAGIIIRHVSKMEGKYSGRI